VVGDDHHREGHAPEDVEEPDAAGHLAPQQVAKSLPYLGDPQEQGGEVVGGDAG
jgi:hypothetical protein